jgi:phosphohistidine phosphatase
VSKQNEIFAMNILLIRHADALSAGESGAVDDESRPLSDAGHAQCAPLARAIERFGARPQVVISSPLLRARQTASGLLPVWDGSPPELRTADELAPGAKRSKLARLLRGLSAETVALVGHMPDLGQFAAWLIGSKKAHIDFAKAGAACLVTDTVPGKGGAALVWMVTPDVCAAVK